MKHLFEFRFGPPKSFKTGAVVSSYPKPMLVLLFDPNGLSVFSSPIFDLAPSKLSEYLAAKRTDPVVCIDFSRFAPTEFDTGLGPAKSSDIVSKFSDTIRILVSAKDQIPFQTVVFDSATSFSDAVYNHIGKTGGDKILADAMKWAGIIGLKTSQAFGILHLLQCHVVVIAHDDPSRAESRTGDGAILNIDPLIYGQKVRNSIPGIFDQVLYQTCSGGEVKVQVQPGGLTRGVGCRWPRYDTMYIKGGRFQDLYKPEDFGTNDVPKPTNT